MCSSDLHEIVFPGESQFFVSMEDDLMRLFGGDRLKTMMERLQVPDDVPLENSMVSRAIESAQKKVEGRNFDIRRHVLQYDDVMNKHREIIYKRRQRLLMKIAGSDERLAMSDELAANRLPLTASQEASLHEEILSYIAKEISALVNVHASSIDAEEWTLKDLHTLLAAIYPPLGEKASVTALEKFQQPDEILEYLVKTARELYEKKCNEHDLLLTADAQRIVTLRAIDTHWMDHIDEMAHLREQVAFSGFAQRDPLIEYKDRGFRLFQALITKIESTIVHSLFQIDFRQFAPRVFLEQARAEQQGLETNIDEIEEELTETGVASAMRSTDRVTLPAHRSKSGGGSSPRLKAEGVSKGSPLKQEKVGLPAEARRAKVGRNDPCPCGSGKKFKKCHGQFA